MKRPKRPEPLYVSTVRPGMHYLNVAEYRPRVRRKLLDAFRDEVFVESFPPSDHAGYDVLADAIVDGDDRRGCVLAVEEDGTVTFGCIADYDEETRVFLMAYLASRPDRRNQGIAAEIMAEFAAVSFDAVKPSLCLGEVDDPLAVPEGEYGDPIARLRLYERFGLNIVWFPYVLPSVGDAERHPGSLLLCSYVDPEMVELVDGIVTVPSSVVDQYMRGYFESCEGADYEDDPQVAEMFAYLAERERIELRPLSEWESCPRPSKA